MRPSAATLQVGFPDYHAPQAFASVASLRYYVHSQAPRAKVDLRVKAVSQ